MTDQNADRQVRDPETLRTELNVQLDQAAKEVLRRMAGGVSHESARQAVTAAYHRLATHAQVHNFPPILAARSAQKTLGQEGLYGASTRDQSRRARVLTGRDAHCCTAANRIRRDLDQPSAAGQAPMSIPTDMRPCHTMRLAFLAFNDRKAPLRAHRGQPLFAARWASSSGITRSAASSGSQWLAPVNSTNSYGPSTQSPVASAAVRPSARSSLPQM